MFKRATPKKFGINEIIAEAGRPAHCDARILHAPGECSFCDQNATWQMLRQLWGIAFTGYEPEGTELPCPADKARGENHQKWQGNHAAKFCTRPPAGWYCTREPEHAGPCAAVRLLEVKPDAS